MDLITYEDLIKSESAARSYLLKFCWKNHQRFCPRCRMRKNYRLNSGRRRCARCGYTFHDFSRRWINNCQISCRQWLRLVKLFELEVPTRQITSQLKLSYNTTYKALNTLRLAITAHGLDARQILGNEDGLGLAPGGRSYQSRIGSGPGTVPVFGIMEKSGLAFVDMIPGFYSETIRHFKISFQLRTTRLANVIYTDKYQRYLTLIFCGRTASDLKLFKGHEESVTIDGTKGFWSFVKPRLMKYNGIRPDRFPLYLKELQFRYNHREEDIFPLLIEYLCDFVPDLKQVH